MASPLSLRRDGGVRGLTNPPLEGGGRAGVSSRVLVTTRPGVKLDTDEMRLCTLERRPTVDCGTGGTSADSHN